MEIVRPLAFGSVIAAGLLLLGCDVQFQRNSEHLYHLRTPVSPNVPISTGEQERHYDFEMARANFGGIFLPNADGDEADELVRVHVMKHSYDHWEFIQSRARNFPEGDIRRDTNRQRIRYTERDIIPYYGHLFQFSLEEGLVHLEECTRQFPPELVPAAGSRVLTIDESEATLLEKQTFGSSDSDEPKARFERIQLVKIETRAEGTQAAIQRTKMISRKIDGEIKTDQEGEPMQQWVSIGANLMIGDQLVRVKQIVPHEKIEGVGTPVGWIELELVDLSPVEMHRAML